MVSRALSWPILIVALLSALAVFLFALMVRSPIDMCIVVRASTDPEAFGVVVEVTAPTGSALESLWFPPTSTGLRVNDPMCSYRTVNRKWMNQYSLATLESGYLGARLNDSLNEPIVLEHWLRAVPPHGITRDYSTSTSIVVPGLLLVPSSAVVPREGSKRINMTLEINASVPRDLMFGESAPDVLYAGPPLERIQDVGRYRVFKTESTSPSFLEEIQAVCENLDHLLDDKARGASLIVHQQETLPAAVQLLEGSNILVVLTTTDSAPSPETVATALWNAGHRHIGDTVPESLQGLLAHHAGSYFGWKVAAALGSDRLQYRAEQMISEYYYFASMHKIRPIPARPFLKLRWERLIPGLLALRERRLQDLGVLEADWPLGLSQAVMSSSEQRCVELFTGNDAVLRRVILEGAILGVECEDEVSFLPGFAEAEWRPADTVAPISTPSETSLLVHVGGDQLGYLETCGCKARQLGGVARRATALATVIKANGLMIEAGNFLPKEYLGSADAIRLASAQVQVEALLKMQYDAIVPGWQDIVSGFSFLRDISHRMVDLPLVAANLIGPNDQLVFPPYRVVSRGDKRYAVVGWISRAGAAGYEGALDWQLCGYQVREDISLLQTAVEEASKMADFVLVSGMLPHWYCRFLVINVPQLDLIATGMRDSVVRAEFAPGSNPDRRADKGLYRINDVWVLEATGAQMAVCISEMDMALQSIRARTVTYLDESVPTEPGINELIGKLAELSEVAFGSVTTARHAQGGFIGAQACAGCHPAYYDDWQRTMHAKAVDSLIKVQRERHGECVKCHVTGYGYQAGFVDVNRRQHLQNVQCEVCHGAGEMHSQTGAVQLITRTPDQQICLHCHDAEHSDQFAGRWNQALQQVSHHQLGSAGGR